MNWVAFALTAWVFVGLEVGLRSALELGQTGIAPSFVIPLGVFVALGAPGPQALWACLLLGLSVDLTRTVDAEGGEALTMIGPYALGMLLGGQLTLSARGVLIRRNPLTLGALSVLVAVVAQAVVMVIALVHRLYGDPLASAPGGELWPRLASALATGVAGLVLAKVLTPLTPVFMFPQTHRWGSGSSR